MSAPDLAIDEKLAAELAPTLIEALQEWQRSTGNRLSLETWLTAGHTRAKVAVVLVAGACPPTRVILKACPPDRLTAREPRLHTQALAESPQGFADQHLVRQQFETVESSDKWRALFQSVAGDSLRVVRPLESVLDDARLPELLTTIGQSILREWNPDFVTLQIAPKDLLRAELGTKTDRNGPLAKFVTELDIQNEQWLRFAFEPARTAPNAILWALKEDLWPPESYSIWAHLGRAHGDLHPGNVLIRVQPTPTAAEFQLIDLSNFTPKGSLARDLVHMALSVVGNHLSDSHITMRQLAAIVLGYDVSVPLHLRGVNEVVSKLRDVGQSWQSAETSGLQDDWEAQFAIAIVSEALQFVGRTLLPRSHRLWFLGLASFALGQFFDHWQLVTSPDDPGTVRLLGDYVDNATEDALEQTMDACGHFSGTHATVAVLSESVTGESSARLGDLPWTGVMSFDPALDNAGGALAVAKSRDHRGLHRLVTAGQSAEYGHGATVWHALAGLAGQEAEAVNSTNLRAWRRAYMRTIEDSLAALGRFTSRPLTVVVFGDPDDRIRALVEAIDDRFSARSKVLLISQDRGSIGDFVDTHIVIDSRKLLAAIPSPDLKAMELATIPGHDGSISLDPQDEQWIREMGDLLSSQAGASAEGIEDVGQGFLQGRAVTWFELGLNIDVVPQLARDLDTRVREDLAARDTTRIALFHYPGAGGSTLARRVAWQVHLNHPSLYCPGVLDEAGLAQRVERLARLSGLSVLLVIEQVTDVIADRLYNRLRSDSVPVVILVVSRRVQAPTSPGNRSFYLGYASTRIELALLRDRYCEYAPSRRAELEKIREGTPNAVPFLFGLTAFQEKYSGIEEYVYHSMARLNDEEKFVTLAVALIHRYAGVSIAEDFFANVLAVAPDSPVDLTRLLSEDARAVLVEDDEGFWRTPHWLVSAEILRQALAPGGDRNSWQVGLSGVSLRVIEEARSVFGAEVPDDISDVLKRLFVFRENRELFGEARLRSFSELLEDVPSLEGRLEVLRRLAETFPSEPHFWAHFGRLLSYEAGDTAAAMGAINKALALDSNDTVFHHIRGMIYLRQLRDLRSLKGSLDEDELLRLAELALADFSDAAELDDDSEYPHVASIRVCVDAVEIGCRAAGFDSFASFLARPTATPYRAMVDRAEASLGAIAEIRGADPMSSRAEEAANLLNGLYDDYSALLQGWRNLLDRADVVKGPVRRRLVRAYVRRAGDWGSMARDDQRKALELLEENLRDDPTDEASLRDWLRAARLGSVSLDRAGELVSYWAQRTDSRDALYYDYVIAVLQVLNGRESAWREARRKIDRCRERAVSFGNRKFSYEWLGSGDGLEMLVHYSQIPESTDLNRPSEVPNSLRRVAGRVATINSPQAGVLRLEPGGLDAFFVPARAGAIRGRHENVKAQAVMGFSYDGLRAWGVELGRTSSTDAP